MCLTHDRRVWLPSLGSAGVGAREVPFDGDAKRVRSDAKRVYAVAKGISTDATLVYRDAKRVYKAMNRGYPNAKRRPWDAKRVHEDAKRVSRAAERARGLSSEPFVSTMGDSKPTDRPPFAKRCFRLAQSPDFSGGHSEYPL